MSEATFNGKHNLSKAKLLIVLHSARDNDWPSHEFVTGELARLTGLSSASIRSLVWRLHKWGYICQRLKRAYPLEYQYEIGARGSRWLEHNVSVSLNHRLVPDLQKLANKFFKHTTKKV
jgi:hypothetical protein